MDACDANVLNTRMTHDLCYGICNINQCWYFIVFLPYGNVVTYVYK